jgi:AraC-like DNA-binding protein
MERMEENGTTTFASPDEYQAGIRGVTGKGTRVNFIVTSGGDFKARLTWLNLRPLRVLRCSENLPSIAYVSLPPERIVALFPTSTAALIWGGLKLRLGDLVLLGRGERTHQWTSGESNWGLISMSPEQLSASALALKGSKIISPSLHRVLRPPRMVASRLLRLHLKACRVAEIRHQLIENPQVARSLEQELLHALINCLTADDIGGHPARQHHAEIMVRFEETLAAHAGRQLSMPDLCAAIGVPERTLRVCCAEFLGTSPTRYLLLRRLNMARSALRRADPAHASVAEIARNCQFKEPGRFAVTYRSVFGEMPSATLRRSSDKTTSPR